MGCLRRLLVIGIVGLQTLTFALTLVVLGSAGVLGEAALISADDLVVLFILNVGSLVATLVLTVIMWTGRRSGSRSRRRQAREAGVSWPPVSTAAPFDQMGR